MRAHALTSVALSLVALSLTAAAKAEDLSEFSVQIGTYPTARAALHTRDIVDNLSPARIEVVTSAQGEKSYRVLVGQFRGTDEADEFIRENKLQKLFPTLWVNPVKIPHADVRAPSSDHMKGLQSAAALEDAKRDPYVMNMSLLCPADSTEPGGKAQPKHQGTYKALLTPEPGQLGGEIQMSVHWSCENKTAGRRIASLAPGGPGASLTDPEDRVFNLAEELNPST